MPAHTRERMNGSKVSLIEHSAQPVGQGRTYAQHVDHTVASYSPLTDKAIVIRDSEYVKKVSLHVRRLPSRLIALTFSAGSL